MKSLRQHQSDAAKARHANKTPEERSAYAKMMVQKREEKRAAAQPRTQSDEWAAAGLCVACGGERRHAKNCRIVTHSFGG